MISAVDGITFKAMSCRELRFTSKAQAKASYGRIQNSLKAFTFTVPQLCGALQKGHPIRTSVLEGGRSDENFKLAWLVGGDVDNKTEQRDADGNVVKAPGENGKLKTLYRALRPDEEGYLYREKALARCRDYGIMPVCAYSTLSDKPGWPRYRLLFLLSRAVTDAGELHRTVAGLLALFPEMDQACSNVSRFYLGSNGEVFETYRRAGWEPCDPGRFTALAPKEPPKRGKSGKPHNMRPLRDGEVHVDDIDLLDLMIRDAGKIARQSEKYVVFETCPICGHGDCLVYIRDTNHWKCFSDQHHARRGGNAAGYIAARKGISYRAAKEWLGDRVG